MAYVVGTIHGRSWKQEIICPDNRWFKSLGIGFRKKQKLKIFYEFKSLDKTAYNELLLEQEDTVYFHIVEDTVCFHIDEEAKTKSNKYGDTRQA